MRRNLMGSCWALLPWLMTAACRSSVPEETAKPPGPSASPPEVQRPSPPSASLALTGFNYTDLAIESFSVDSQGGGNIVVSSPTSGGGGSVCCVSISPNRRLPFSLSVKWTRDLKRWCERDVQVLGPIPATPHYFAVHFYPDGHLEAELTEDYPEVRLSLPRFSRDERKASGNTVVDEQTARCHDEKQ